MTPDRKRSVQSPWKSVETSARMTPALLEACAAFSIRPVRAGRNSKRVERAPGDILDDLRSLKPGATALITGPSGSGKSRLLERLSRDLAQRDGIERVSSPVIPLDRRSIIDMFSLPARAFDLLARVGLAEARLFPRRARELSAGEQDRLALALAIDRALTGTRKTRWIVVDEFTSTLDRLTAASVIASASRWFRRRGADACLSLLAATAHEDVPPMLAPDLLITCAHERAATLERPDAGSRMPRLPRITIEEGTTSDYDLLAPHHYRAGRPATSTRVLRAVYRDERVGVLVVSRPTMNGSWRELAWPGRYVDSSRTIGLRRLNREVRCLSRLVIDPRCRGLGLATRLAKAYLAGPQTPATESMAMMGGVCPFLEHAGMTPYELPTHPADGKLADALEHARIEPWELMKPEPIRDPFLLDQLEQWARDRRLSGLLRDKGSSTKDAATGETQPQLTLATNAAMRLVAKPVAYAHTKKSWRRPR